MSLDSVKIERVKVKDLSATAARFIDGTPPGTFIPITKHRADALAHNPYADPDDVALLLATEGGRCVGYFGVMPVLLQHEGKLHKVHWLTTWAVSQDYLGKGLGSRLMEEALSLDVDLAIVGSKPARRVSAKYGFQKVAPLEYVQIDFGVAGHYNFVSLLLRGLRKMLAAAGAHLQIDRLDRFFNKVFEGILGFAVRPLFVSFATQKATALSQFVMKQARPAERVTGFPTRSGTSFVRDERVLNWMMEYPWVLPGGSASEGLRYEFTDSRLGFEQILIEVDSGTRKDFAAFQYSKIRGRGMLKVLDTSIDYPALLLAVALKVAKEKGVTVIEGPTMLTEPLGRGLLSRMLVRRRQRTLQVHPRSAGSPLAKAWPHLEQTYVDGDVAFT